MLSAVAWPSGLRRWFKAPVSSGAWVRIPPLPKILIILQTLKIKRLIFFPFFFNPFNVLTLFHVRKAKLVTVSLPFESTDESFGSPFIETIEHYNSGSISSLEAGSNTQARDEIS